MKAVSVLGSTPLETLILDGVNRDKAVFVRAEDFCTDVRRVKRLSVKSDRIIAVDLDILPCVKNIEVLSTGYFNMPYFSVPVLSEVMLGDLDLSAFSIESVDVSNMFSFGPGYGDKYCHDRAPISNDDFFPPPLESFPLIDSNLTLMKADNVSFWFPSGIRFLDISHFGLQLMTIRPRYYDRPITINNSLMVLNASYNEQVMSRAGFPAIGNLWQLQILDLSHNGIQSIGKEAQDASKDSINLRYFNMSHNRLFESGSDFEDTFSELHELVSINLSNNGIELLHNKTFANNSNLEEILLSDNNLDYTTTLLVSANPKLKFIDLSNNHFHHLSDGMMAELDQLAGQVMVDISNNPFVCGCEAITFIRWLNKTQVDILKADQLTCSYHDASVSLLHFKPAILVKECAKANFKGMLKNLLLGFLTPTIGVFLLLDYSL